MKPQETRLESMRHNAPGATRTSFVLYVIRVETERTVLFVDRIRTADDEISSFQLIGILGQTCNDGIQVGQIVDRDLADGEHDGHHRPACQMLPAALTMLGALATI